MFDEDREKAWRIQARSAKRYKCWHLPTREGNSATYLVCHFAELPLEEEGLGLNSTHPFPIPLGFCFARQVASLAAPPAPRESNPFSISSHGSGLGATVYSLTRQRGAGAGPGYCRKALSGSLGEGRTTTLLALSIC